MKYSEDHAGSTVRMLAANKSRGLGCDSSHLGKSSAQVPRCSRNDPERSRGGSGAFRGISGYTKAIPGCSVYFSENFRKVPDVLEIIPEVFIIFPDAIEDNSGSFRTIYDILRGIPEVVGIGTEEYINGCEVVLVTRDGYI